MAAIQRLEELRRDVHNELGDAAEELDIDVRIGISTGEMIVGTLGSDATKNFTVIGDAVNLGSRLEGANKAYGTRILIAGETYKRTSGNGLQFREMDLLRVKGKEEPVRVYELLPQVARTHMGAEILKCFENGLKSYRARDWQKAESSFATVLAQLPEDGPSKTYLDRIRYFRENPPPPEWDGIWTLKTM